MNPNLGLGINIVLVGMTVVFMSLLSLAAVISLFKVVFAPKNQSSEAE